MRVKIALLLLPCAVLLLPAFDWPLEQVIVTSTFGEHRGDHFHSGIDLGGGEQPIFPIAPGELVFYYREALDYSSVPTGLGNFLVLQHQGGVRSLYAHLKADSLDPQRKIYDRRRALGTVGSSGYSSGTHLHLTIIDTEMNTVINPLLLLPPLADDQAPEIREVRLHGGQEAIVLEEGMEVPRGEAGVSATVYDLREDVAFLWKLAPYKVSLYQDGRELGAFAFDSLHGASAAAPNSVVLMNTELDFPALYEAPWDLDLGTVNLVPGETTLTVIAADFSGNESSRDYRLSVVE